MEENLCRMKEINEALKGYFINTHRLNNPLGDEKSISFLPTPVPRRKQEVKCIYTEKNCKEPLMDKDKDRLLSSSSNISNSKTSSLSEIETSSSCCFSNSANDTRELLTTASYLRNHLSNLDPKINNIENEDSQENRAVCKYSSNTINSVFTPSNTVQTSLLMDSSITLPRKPRKTCAPKNPSSVKQSNTMKGNKNNLYCFVNTSYTASSPHPGYLNFTTKSNHLHSQNEMDSNHHTLKIHQETNSLKIERLKRPSAPPPPPPAISNFGSPQLTSTPTRQIPIGFEPLQNQTLTNIGFRNTFKLQPSIFLQPVKKPVHFDLIVLLSAFFLFLVCILAISLFQTKANQFYLKFMNVSTNNSGFNSNKSDIELLESATGSDLVKQTILVCNGPWFSYQMNNLLVMPFSLLLLFVISLVKKKTTSFSRIKRSSKSSNCVQMNVPSGLNPFQRRNRFLVAALFCILANEIFKMIESSIFATPTTTFNSTSELFQSVFLPNISKEKANLNQSNESTNSSFLNSRTGTDLLRIGLGMEPEQLAQHRSRASLLFGKTTKGTSTRPGLIHLNYLKPKLKPKLNKNDFESTKGSELIINFRIDVDQQMHRIRNAGNKSLLIISSLNSTIQNSSSQTLFEFSMSLYRNQYVQSALHKLVQSFNATQFKWTLIWSRLEKIGIIIIEVLVIGLRYYPLIGILDNNNRLFCLALAALYMWLDVVYNITITGLCEGLRLNLSFELLKDLRTFFGVGSVIDHKSVKSSQQIDARFLFSTKRIIYTFVKSLPHFFCLAYVTMRITCECVLRTFQILRRKLLKRRKKSTNEKALFEDEKNVLSKFIVNSTRTYDLVYTKFDLKSIKKPHSSRVKMELSFEDKYIKNLLKASKPECYDSDRFLWIKKVIDSNFRFSIGTISIYTVCFTVLYYFTCFFCFYSSIFVDLIYFPPVYKHYLLFSALLTSFICFIQLFLSLFQFKRNLMSFYQGKSKPSTVSAYSLMPSLNRKIVTASFNYAGYAVTYTCWGYIILFILTSFIAFQAATLVVFGGLTSLVLFLFFLLFPLILSYTLFKFLNRIIGTMAARFCFLQQKSKVLALKNIRVYSLFLYFKFFYDCFTGLALCLLRILKAILISILFITRLDFPLMGLCKFDSGYMAYLGYLQWEAAHTNPVAIGFCEMLIKEANLREIKRREKWRQMCGLLDLSSKGKNTTIRARTKWFLAYTLIKNKELVINRKKPLL